MEGLDTYLLALGLYVTLRGLFKVYMNYYDHRNTLVILALLTFGVSTAQNYTPFDPEVPTTQVGEVSTLELYQTDEYVIFYNYEVEKWASVRMNELEREGLYEIFLMALDEGYYRFGIRKTAFKFDHHSLEKSRVRISDPFGQSVSFKISKRQLGKLFNIEK